MDCEESDLYKQQQIEQALLTCPEGPDKDELVNLKKNIEELLLLTDAPSTSTKAEDPLSDEYALFMAEMEKEGVVAPVKDQALEAFKHVEGMKCRAPHKHQWGDVAYHNAMICSIIPEADNEIKVKQCARPLF
ncbi:hypothetical protein NQ315_012670 [Exocentrus adspersus]|uniref:Uncharacterized protein n=1 Tax=Exocentrus adspersus TaxID=1586481 RepID=A0AAV8VS07_9CUCU|nr:hypothetical protein NQ315_012670 [Exocentrus adspersus]